MLHNNSIAVKFFLVFFLTSVTAILLMIVIIYFAVKNNVVNNNIKRLEIIHNIKEKQLQNAISSIEHPLIRFLKNNSDSYGFDKLINAYNNISNGVSNETIKICKQHLLKHYSRQYINDPVIQYLNTTLNDAVPISDAGILAQCIDFIDITGIKSIEGINLETPNIKLYKDFSHYFSDIFEVLLDAKGFENILFVSANDDIVYTPKQSSALGHNLISSYWIKGLSKQISKFHSTLNTGDSEYYIVDMQPYMPLGGYPVFFIVAPIFKDNKYNGSIILVFPASFIDSILSDNNNWKNEGLGATGDIFITDMNGVFRSNNRNLIENKNDYLLLLKNIKNSSIAYDMVKYFGTSAYYSSVIRSSPINNKYKGYEFSKTVDGLDIVTYHSLLNIGDLKWILLVRMELNEIISEMAPIKMLIYSMVIPIIILLLAITATVAYFTTKPIRQMQKNCVAIAMGEKTFIDINGSYKEINDLIKSFKNMITTLIDNEQQTNNVKKALEESILNKAVIAQELREEKDFISNILETKGFIVFVIDDNDKIIRTNSAMQSFFPNKNLVGIHYKEIIPDEYKLKLVSIISLLKKGDTQISNLVTELTINEEHIVIEWNLSLFTNRNFENGHLVQFVTAIGINVTEKHKTEKSLKENTDMFNKIFSNAYDTILITDENNNILLANKSFELLFDTNYLDILGKPIITNIISNEYKNVILLDTQEGKSLEIEALYSDKSKFPVDISISKIMYQGKFAILYILRDASLRKKKERELQIALNRAKDAERIKTEFIANMSHEIRTPLNGIMGFIDLLKETKLDNIQQEYLKIVDSSYNSLFSIINDILDFSKIESGKMQLEYIEFNSWNVFEDSVAIYAAKAMDKNILLICLFSIDMPKYLLGDPLRIRQIITNLISNAIKFTDVNGRVILRATLVSENSEKCKIRISVKDNGIGIKKEQQQKIMDVFSQADTSTTRHYGGSGLGLAISKSIIQSMNSTLNLYSEYGSGSEFYFTLELPIIEKKDTQLNVDFSNIKIILLGSKEDWYLKDLYEEYIKDVKAQVIYTTNTDDILPDDVKIVGISYDDNEYEFIKNIVNNFKNKYFIIFSTSSIDNKIYDLDGENIYTLTTPINISKLIFILSDILGYNKLQCMKDKKIKNISFQGHILLVDDNEVNSKFSEILLKNMGLTVDIAENGQEAIDKYKSNNYDLIFMDIYMPIKDGLTATKEIIDYEKENGLSHIPIVALTANVIEDDIEEYIAVGMDDFVAKPIVKNKLETVLKRYLIKDNIDYNDDLIKGVINYLKSDNYELISAEIKEYYQTLWHYVQKLLNTVTEFNEEASLYIINKMYIVSEKYQFTPIINLLDKIRKSVSDGIYEDIFPLIDEIKDILYKIKYSVRLYK